MQRTVDVLIVGAGLSGLYAARTLHRLGLKIRVLEARDRIGGRVLSQKLANGGTVDLGGQWIGPGQHRMYQLAHEYGLKTVATHTRGDTVFAMNRQFRQMPTSFPPMSWLGKLDTLQLGWRLNRVVHQLSVTEPWQHPRASRMDNSSFTQWLHRNTISKEARSYWQYLIESGICNSGDRISLLEVLHQLATVGGLQRLETAESEFFVDGAQTLAHCMAQELGDCIQLQTPVRSLKQNGALIQVGTDSGEVSAKHVILAIPPQLLGTLDFDESLGTSNPGAVTNQVLGQVVKVLVVYDHAWWRTQGLSGVANTPNEPIDYLADGSLPNGDPGILVALASGPRGIQLSQMSAEDRKATVLSYIQRVLGEASGQLVDMVCMDWISEPFSHGGYASRRSIRGWTHAPKVLIHNDERIHIAGTETATEWRSYMEGALQSAERASAEVVQMMNTEARANPA